MKRSIVIIGLLLSFTISSFAQDAKKYTTYIVKEGQSLKQIAKIVGCRVKVLKNLNPDMDKYPTVNTTLVVPNKKYGKKTLKKDKKKPVVAQKKVIVHKVKQGDTFYGIAKEYNVTIQSIKDANPQLTDGLKPNQKIRIPFKEEFTVQKRDYKVVFYKVVQGDTKYSIAKKHKISVEELEKLNPKHEGDLKIDENIVVPALKEVVIVNATEDPDAPEKEVGIIYHKVLQGEGLFRIAVIYNTTEERLRELNPEATKMLRPGMLLKVPGKKKDKFLTHTVLKGDTFYSLTRHYEVSKEDLIQLNPDLKEGLKVGSILKIKPIKEELITLDRPLLIDSIINKRFIQLSFMMPLMLTDKEISKKEKQLQNISSDFYMGAEMALDSLRKQGLQFESHVYDTKNNASEVYDISQSEEFKNSNIIIGPFFFDKAQILAQSTEGKIFTPLFSKKQISDTTPNIIKSTANKLNLSVALSHYLAQHYTNENIIIISDEKPDNKTKATELGRLLRAKDSISNVSYIYPSHNKKDETQLYMDKEELEKSIIEDRETWIILISDNSIINSDVVNSYGVMADDNKIQLFTLKAFDKYNYLDFNLLSELKWSFPAVQFNNLNTKENTQFITDYKNKNHTFPNTYAYAGFDLTYDALIRMITHDNDEEALLSGTSNRLAHQYNYVKTPQNDFKNNGMMMIRFNKEMEFESID